LNNEKKARPDRSSVCDLCIYHNNQNMIAIVAVRTNIDNNFLSHQYNGLHLANCTTAVFQAAWTQNEAWITLTPKLLFG
jgi:hypothetical protein